MDLRTLAGGRGDDGARFDIRYSPRCLAAWARVGHAAVGDRLDVRAAGGRTYEVRIGDAYDAAGYVYTPMAYLGPGRLVSVCLAPAHGGRHCVSARSGR